MTDLNIQVELTNHCNLQCAECPHRIMKRKLRHMEEDVFAKALEYMAMLNPQTVILHKDGEPLLHPRFKEYFARVVQTLPTKKIDLYTNGHFLTPELAHYLSTVASKNDLWILVSFHPHRFDGKLYNLTNVFKNTLFAVQLQRPNVQFVVTIHRTDFTNDIENKKWENFWLDVRDQYKNIYAVHVNTLINPWGGRIKHGTLTHFYKCPYEDEDHFFIGVTGNVLPCCIDLEEELVLGNIMNDEFETIRKRRRDFYIGLRRRPSHRLCQNCIEER